jgi:hypothetical protein
MNRLTDPPFLHCLCRTRKYDKHMCHDLPEQVRHVGREWDTSVTAEALKEKLNALKESGKCIIIRDNILHRLS